MCISSLVTKLVLTWLSFLPEYMELPEHVLVKVMVTLPMAASLDVKLLKEAVRCGCLVPWQFQLGTNLPQMEEMESEMLTRPMLVLADMLMLAEAIVTLEALVRLLHFWPIAIGDKYNCVTNIPFPLRGLLKP